MEQGIKQAVAHFLQQIGCAGITHERRAGCPTNGGARKRGGNEGWRRAKSGLHFGQIHFLIDRTEHQQRFFLMHERTHRVIIGLLTALTGDCKGAGQAKVSFKIVLNAARIGVTGHNGERGGGEKILRHRAPEVPNGLNGGMLFLFDKRFRIQVQKSPPSCAEIWW